MRCTTILPIGLLLDRLLGEPRRWHPLVGFGRLAGALERGLRRGAPGAAVGNRLRGSLAWALLVLPLPLACAWLLSQLAWPAALAGHALLLWFALGSREGLRGSMASSRQAQVQARRRPSLPEAFAPSVSAGV